MRGKSVFKKVCAAILGIGIIGTFNSVSALAARKIQENYNYEKILKAVNSIYDSSSEGKKEAERAKNEFEKKFTAMKSRIVEFKKLKPNEVFEMDLKGGQVWYLMRDKDGKFYLFIGTLLGEDGTNYTYFKRFLIQNKNAAKNISLFKEKERNSVTLGSGKEAIFYVVIDPECPHCRKLVKFLEKNKDKFTAHLYVISLSPYTYQQALFIMCGKNQNERLERLLDVMSGIYDSYSKEKMKAFVYRKCEVDDIEKARKILDENYSIAVKAGFSGTPYVLIQKGSGAYLVNGANIPLIKSLLGLKEEGEKEKQAKIKYGR